MRAALLLAATVVVANARPTWRADRAIMPASAISPTVTKNTARARASQPYTPTLANSNLYAHTGVSQEMAARARAARTESLKRNVSTPLYPSWLALAARYQTSRVTAHSGHSSTSSTTKI